MYNLGHTAQKITTSQFSFHTTSHFSFQSVSKLHAHSNYNLLNPITTNTNLMRKKLDNNQFTTLWW